MKRSALLAVLLVTAGFLALHLALAALIPMISDEAYYALWSSVLDWDYFDHPPMIAAMIRVGTASIGMTPFGLRLTSVLAMAGSSLLVAGIAARRAGDEALALRAVIYFNIGFLVLGVGTFATPDAPSTFFWLLATYAALCAAPPEGGRLWWVVAGLACGLGVMSKFTNMFLPVGLVLWLILTTEGRACLRRSGPWIAVAAALLPVLPLIWWNIAHHGLGFERQFGRIVEAGRAANGLPHYLLMLVVLPTPVIGLLALRGVWRAPPMLLWSITPLLAYFARHALHGVVELNWPIPAMGAMAVMAAQAAEGLGRRLRGFVVVSGAVLSFGLMAALFNPRAPLNAADNPANQMRGWQAALSQISAEVKGAAWIATTDYGTTGRMWVSFPGLPVRAVTEPQRWGFRGPFPPALCTLPGLLVERADDDPGLAATLFATVGPATLVDRSSAGVLLKTYRLRQVQHVLDKGLCPGT